MDAAYKNQTSFGMAFKKPDGQVIGHFKQVMEHISPEERKKFVDNVSAIVESAKSNPVPITQGVINPGYYTAEVCDTTFYNKEKTAAAVLDTMQKAANYATNRHNLHQNMCKIGKIFNIEV